MQPPIDKMNFKQDKTIVWPSNNTNKYSNSYCGWDFTRHGRLILVTASCKLRAINFTCCCCTNDSRISIVFTPPPIIQISRSFDRFPIERIFVISKNSLLPLTAQAIKIQLYNYIMLDEICYLKTVEAVCAVQACRHVTACCQNFAPKPMF